MLNPGINDPLNNRAGDNNQAKELNGEPEMDARPAMDGEPAIQYSPFSHLLPEYLTNFTSIFSPVLGEEQHTYPFPNSFFHLDIAISNHGIRTVSIAQRCSGANNIFQCTERPWFPLHDQ